MTTLIRDTRESNARLAIYVCNKYEEEEPSKIEKRKITGFEVVAMSDEEARALHVAIDDNGEYLVIYENNCKVWFRNSYVDLFVYPNRR